MNGPLGLKPSFHYHYLVTSYMYMQEFMPALLKRTTSTTATQPLEPIESKSTWPATGIITLYLRFAQ